MSETSRRQRKKTTQDAEVSSALSGLDETDAETAALIRAMLAQDQSDSPYLDDTYDNAFATKGRKSYRESAPREEELDDDFVPEDVQSKLKKLQSSFDNSPASSSALTASTAAANRASSKPRAKPIAAVPPSDDEGAQAHASTAQAGHPTSSSPPPEPSKKRKRATPTKPASSNYRQGKWGEDEEVLFIEALELHGRDWGLVQARVGTRDRNAIRSHAQKHFAKLARNQTSSASEAMETDPPSSAQPVAGGQTDSIEPPPPKRAKSSNEVSTLQSPKKVIKGKKKPLREADFGMDIGALLYGHAMPVYEKQRLRDRNSTAWRPLHDLQDKNPLTLVKTQKFDEGAQPFRVRVHSNALLLADIHSHLARVEIIGFLAGSWDAAEKVLTIEEAFPCKSLSTGDDETNVEMDPTSELEVRQLIAARNLRVVGWYHSHPMFPPDPSIRDIENQLSYQKLFVDQVHHCEPFVGVIIGTYDIRMPTSESIVNWFYVDSLESKGQPFYVVSETLQDPEVTEALQTEVTTLLQFYSSFAQRTNFKEVWRYNLTDEQKQLIQAKHATNGANSQQPELQQVELDEIAHSARCTKLSKFLESLRVRLALYKEEWRLQWLETLQTFIDNKWQC